jgi:hypothetical protein
MDLGALAWVERSNKIMVEGEGNIPTFTGGMFRGVEYRRPSPNYLMYNMWLLVWMLHFIRSWLLGCAVHHSHGHHG